MIVCQQDATFGLVLRTLFDHQEALVQAKFRLLWLTELSTSLTQTLTHRASATAAGYWRAQTRIRHQRNATIVHVHLQLNIVHKSWVSTPSTTI